MLIEEEAVESLAVETEDKDLERLFAEARRYPLLTSQQEKSIDGSKWQAVTGLQKLLVRDKVARHYLRAWSSNTALTPLDIAYFTNREHHFILRRELSNYMADGKQADRMEALHSALQKNRTPRTLDQRMADLDLPASLTVGIAVVVLRLDGVKLQDSVADALEQWSTFWTHTEKRPKTPLEASVREELIAHMESYSDARDTLTMHNLRLVYSIAGRYRGKGVNYLDLIQEGTLGLIRAAEKYDHSKGFRFSTYCFNWITQAIRRHVGDTGGLIRYPTHVQEQVNKLYRLRVTEKQRTGEEPGDAALAEAAGLTLEKTRDLLQLRNLGVSLDAPQFDDDDGTLLDTMSGGPFDASESEAETESLHDRLLLEMEELDKAEREVVIARWGLHDGPPLSRAEIADRMSVSREWVRQLERAALTKLSGNERIRSAFADYMEASD
ncbi:RNA polymerase sigma factor, sigma-70 family [Congregibacter litoralis KT71]|uniref:RNA polymerase sigma factor n=1 Tax=Congregibacter litoralis KT71 TaxID=314285 RepID=A4A8B6_9GAMM|nr:RNA polymerase sigma factor, sigma-70 family [Congregibacter litoralis KT71]